mmetsp:Transcript_115764/g.332569  ORF Transcript_115764/g.332569 Transcript_115764/m.332569 type:complete len:303 (+) Transcript_115764:1384-2292(+)
MRLLRLGRGLLRRGGGFDAHASDLFLLDDDLLLHGLLLRRLHLSGTFLRRRAPLLRGLLSVCHCGLQVGHLLGLQVGICAVLLRGALRLLDGLLQLMHLAFGRLISLTQLLHLLLPAATISLGRLGNLRQLLGALLRLGLHLLAALGLVLHRLCCFVVLAPELEHLGAEGSAAKAIGVQGEVREEGLRADLNHMRVHLCVHLHSHRARSELEGVDGFADMLHSRARAHQERGLAIAADATLEDAGELRIAEGDVRLLGRQGADYIAECQKAFVDVRGFLELHAFRAALLHALGPGEVHDAEL